MKRLGLVSEKVGLQAQQDKAEWGDRSNGKICGTGKSEERTLWRKTRKNGNEFLARETAGFRDRRSTGLGQVGRHGRNRLFPAEGAARWKGHENVQRNDQLEEASTQQAKQTDRRIKRKNNLFFKASLTPPTSSPNPAVACSPHCLHSHICLMRRFWVKCGHGNGHWENLRVGQIFVCFFSFHTLETQSHKRCEHTGKN